MKKFYFLLVLFFSIFSGNAQIINIPDPNFKAALYHPLVAYDQFGQDVIVDANENGEIEVEEVQSIIFLDVSNSNISDLTGISYFTALGGLDCSHNLLTTITIDPAIELNRLNASHNALTSISVNMGSWSQGLDLSYNNLSSHTIDSGNYYETVNLSHNQLSSLTINNASFEYFDVSYNNLSSIQINGNVSAYYRGYFNHNQFSLLDLTNFNFHYEAWVYFGSSVVDRVHFGVQQPGNIGYGSDNTFVDFGNFAMVTSCEPENMGHISINNSPNLNYIVLKNGFNHTVTTCTEGSTTFENPALALNISNCPNLSFICVDELEQPYIQARINQLGLQNQVQVNSYCPFNPGETYYSVNGMARFDYDGNGCDSNDFHVPFQKFATTNGSESGTIIANEFGNYEIHVGAGPQTVTPIVPASGVYTISPASLMVNFPADTSPYNQNFCLTSSGIHPDLEISLIPINFAIPGFNASYKLVYRNKGNQVQSGTINLTFNDAVLDLVSANPTNTSQTPNALTWNFSNLQPFENREIIIVLNVNAPTEMPAVNAGDVLAYTASITSAETDETPADNAASLNQAVVNSLDPNDKTCLEGNTISPDMIGQYIHYVIHFENTGTANAQNIVVKDMIDTSKFDIATLIPLNGSHPFITRITETNKVEFIFENINLPFDDANNDGYVAFKIKTKPSLALGDTFSNTANIYFDYNFPIVTNTATTAIQLLGTPDFEFSKYFTLYPNPAKNMLNIEAKNAVQLKSAQIYNMLGQLVLAVTNLENASSIDVADLAAGNYFIKIHSDKGTSVAKFVKN
jgi:hypothetical protein